MGLHILIFSLQLMESRLAFFIAGIDYCRSFISGHCARSLALRFKQTAPGNQKSGVRKFRILNCEAITLFRLFRISFLCKAIAQYPEALPMSWLNRECLCKQRTYAITASIDSH